MSELTQLAQEIGLHLIKKHLMLVTAESCTGGWLAQVMTANPGSSQWFERGFVTYSNAAKQELLAVSEQTLLDYGAVSTAVAMQMACGALTNSQASVALAITGIAGPEGGSVDKPVGTVCFAWATQSGISDASMELFKGDREQIRYAAVKQALRVLDRLLNQH